MFNQDLSFHLLLIIKRLNIYFHNYLVIEITKYLPTHCGALLTSYMTYSLFDNFICKNTPIYFAPMIYGSYVDNDNNSDNNYYRKFVVKNLFVTLCENHKNIVTIPKVNYYQTLFPDYKNQKIDFLINQKKKTKRKLSKNEELNNEESNNKKRKLN